MTLVLAFAGCAQYRTFELPREPAHMRENYQEKDGLTAAAMLVVEPLTVEYYFGPEFRSGGYFTVIVSLENRGPGSFEFERKSFAVVLESGERLLPVAPLEALTDIQCSPVGAATILFAPLVVPSILAYRAREEYNFEMARSFQKNGFPRTLRLEKGDPPYTRALFFLDPKAELRSATEFDSSVLQFLAGVEGAAPEEAVEPIPSPTAKPRSDEKKVGKQVTFTISLTREEIQ